MYPKTWRQIVKIKQWAWIWSFAFFPYVRVIKFGSSHGTFMTRSYFLAFFLSFFCYSCVGSFFLIFIHMHTLYFFVVLDVCEHLVCVCLCQIPTSLHGLWVLPLKPTTIYLTYNQIRNHWTQRNKNSHSHYANTVNIYSIEKYNYTGFRKLSFFCSFHDQMKENIFVENTRCMYVFTFTVHCNGGCFSICIWCIVYEYVLELWLLGHSNIEGAIFLMAKE